MGDRGLGLSARNNSPLEGLKAWKLMVWSIFHPKTCAEMEKYREKADWGLGFS